MKQTGAVPIGLKVKRDLFSQKSLTAEAEADKMLRHIKNAVKRTSSAPDLPREPPFGERRRGEGREYHLGAYR